MKKLLFVMLVMMITSTSFSQHIGKAYIGLSLDETIEQCKSVEYELNKKEEAFLEFNVVNFDQVCYKDVYLRMFFSPESKIVWFGVMTFETKSRKESKLSFLSMFRSLKEKKGEPSEKKRKTITWESGSSVVYIERNKRIFKYTVINTGAFFKVQSEY